MFSPPFVISLTTVTVDGHGVSHRAKITTTSKQRLGFLKITRDIFDPPASQADPVSVISPRDFVMSLPVSRVKLADFLDRSQLAQGVVDGGQRNVRQASSHRLMDLLGRGVVVVLYQGLKDGPPLGGHLVATLSKFLNKLLKSRHRLAPVLELL
jgi:hypothetical protein